MSQAHEQSAKAHNPREESKNENKVEEPSLEPTQKFKLSPNIGDGVYNNTVEDHDAKSKIVLNPHLLTHQVEEGAASYPDSLVNHTELQNEPEGQFLKVEDLTEDVSEQESPEKEKRQETAPSEKVVAPI